MDMKLNREFLYVHSNNEENKISDSMRSTLSKACGCAVTEYAGTVTIACQSLCGLGQLLAVIAIVDNEGPDLRFCGSLQKAIVKFIG